MKWLLMRWMCQKCHLKEIQCERQTLLDQDLFAAIFVLGNITSHFENGPFSSCQIFQIGNLNSDLKYMRK